MGIISKVGLLGANPVGFSMDSYHCQFLVEGNILLNPEHYHRLVGKLINLFVQARTFLLCAYTCSIYVASKIRTLGVVLRVVCYFKGNLRQGILLCTDCDFQLYAQCDSYWANCPLTKGLTSWFILLGNYHISWKTKQHTVFFSSAEVEYGSMVTTVCELKWLKELLSCHGFDDPKLMNLYCDKQVALYIAVDHIFHECPKHIEMDCHFVCYKLFGFGFA